MESSDGDLAGKLASVGACALGDLAGKRRAGVVWRAGGIVAAAASAYGI
jgi:hypothetical protein